MKELNIFYCSLLRIRDSLTGQLVMYTKIYFFKPGRNFVCAFSDQKSFFPCCKYKSITRTMGIHDPDHFLNTADLNRVGPVKHDWQHGWKIKEL